MFGRFYPITLALAAIIVTSSAMTLHQLCADYEEVEIKWWCYEATLTEVDKYYNKVVFHSPAQCTSLKHGTTIFGTPDESDGWPLNVVKYVLVTKNNCTITGEIYERVETVYKTEEDRRRFENGEVLIPGK